MISGFNTDIETNGTMFHVQTEDKGQPACVIMSLVYDGGTILASKRASYDDISNGNFDEKELAKRVSRQHKLICAAVKAGRIKELKAMTADDKAKAKAKAKAKGHAVPAAETAGPSQVSVATAEADDTVVPSLAPFPDHDDIDGAIQAPSFDPFSNDPVIEAVNVIEDDEILPDEAVEVVSELSGRERPSNSKLNLELFGDTKFKGGDRGTVNIMICRGTGRRVVADAQIMIKVLGSSFRPVIFHAKSDANGLANVHLQLPHFHAGRAALLIRAISDGEEIEVRRLVMPG